MSFIEGGNFKCIPTGFETKTRKDWNKHCIEDCDMHTESGTTTCVGCGDLIEFSGLPFVPFNLADGSKSVQLRCDDCETSMKGNVKVTKTQTKKVVPQQQ